MEPTHRPSPAPDSITVAQLASRLAARGRLDPISARRLPVRPGTLVRRTVRALPRRVGGSIVEVAPPPRAGDATRYARALLALFDAYDSIVPGSVLPSVGRLATALEELVEVATGRPAVPGEAFHALITDAYEWQAARLAGDHLDVRHALHDGYLGLIGEGFVLPGRWAAIAAAELAAAALRADQPVAADWYATRALGWAPATLDRRTIDALISAIETLVMLGEHETAIEHSPRLVARLAGRGGMRASSAVTLRCALARAHSDLGEHSLAIRHAEDALARARRAWGARSVTAQVCDLLFDECFQRAVANR
jgi:hypothetical protein